MPDLDPATLETLASLCRRLLSTKLSEEGWKKIRIGIEEKISALIDGPERGQVTVALPDGNKVTVERGFNYKYQADEIEKFCTISGIACPVKVKTTRELDVTGYEWYRDNDTENFAKISEFVVATPKKTAISVKVPK